MSLLEDCFWSYIDECNHKKEVKKVSRPYLECKVVKVKKLEKKKSILVLRDNNTGKHYKVTQYNYTLKIGDVIWYKNEKRILTNCEVVKIINAEKPKPKGNWVNGENLDKIKFPAFCSYQYFISGKKGDKSNGMLMKLGNNYYIANIDSQGDYTPYFVNYDLKFLIENFNIHIIKAKVILFEETTESGQAESG